MHLRSLTDFEMKNRENWKPSKFVFINQRLVGSRDPQELAIGSRLISDLTARYYDKSLPIHAKGKLLDLGCGKVPLYGVYKDFVTEKVVGDS